VKLNVLSSPLLSSVPTYKFFRMAALRLVCFFYVRIVALSSSSNCMHLRSPRPPHLLLSHSINGVALL